METILTVTGVLVVKPLGGDDGKEADGFLRFRPSPGKADGKDSGSGTLDRRPAGEGGDAPGSPDEPVISDLLEDDPDGN